MMENSERPSESLEETKKLINCMIDSVNMARASYELWFTLTEDQGRPEYDEEMNDHYDFFNTIKKGHFRMMFIAISCLFDENGRTANIKKLKKLLRVCRHDRLIQNIDNKLDPHKNLVKDIRAIRHKVIAHIQIDEFCSAVFDKRDISPNKVGELLEDCCILIKEIDNELSEKQGISNIIRPGRMKESTLRLLNDVKKGRMAS